MLMRIELSTGCPAELVRGGQGSRRGLVIIPDIFGLRPLFSDHATRLANEHGWDTCVFEPFPNRVLGPVPGPTDPGVDEALQERFEVIAKMDDDEMLANVAAAADELKTPDTALMGFCMGGMYAMRAATTSRFDKIVSFYGMITLRPMWNLPGHTQPIDAVRRSPEVSILALLGGIDELTPASDIAMLQECPNVETVIYPEATHAFAHDPARPTYRQQDAEDAWRRAATFINSR